MESARDVPPLVYDPIVRQWACQMRGLCCKGYDIHLDRVALSRVFKRLTAAGDARAPLFDPATAEASDDGFFPLPLTAERACHFLEDKLCGYRGHFGAETLPTPCRVYPYASILTPTRQLLGLIFTCPTALGLLAAEPALAVVVDPDGEPPMPFVGDLASDRRAYVDAHGERVSAAAFWDLHWALFERFRASAGAGDVLSRLRALAEHAFDAPCPEPLALTAESLGETRFDAALTGQIFLRGGSPFLLPTLFEPRRPRPLDEPLPDYERGEDDLLGRYLEHRLLVPTFLEERADLGFLVGLLLALAARYRIERARGLEPLYAIHQLDAVFVQGTMPERLFPAGGRVDWRTVAMIGLGGTL
ncbi:MAG: hypothetical protein H6745_05505 [Deltaproteobacteria bacterium]|nr:hypothetical protein [Deltaproteobacteria bacterium]